MHLVKRKDKKTFEFEVRFYVAIIIIVIEFLHSERIVFRDLHLDNILINETGYILLNNVGKLFC